MAHYKRKRPRTKSSGYYSAKGLDYRLGKKADEMRWLENSPRWHDKLHHTRPNRRKVKVLETSVLKQRDPDTLVWPHDRKPHIYYW